MSGPARSPLDDLIARARAAAAVARRQNDRAGRLIAFVRGNRGYPEQLPLRCAWCGRIELGGNFVEPDEFLAHGVSETADERMSHGICPECLERVNAEADRARHFTGPT